MTLHFCSPGGGFSYQGHAAATVPAKPGQHSAQVQALLAQASGRGQGQRRPWLAGALPFDAQDAGFFYLPAEVGAQNPEQLPRGEAQQEPRGGLSRGRILGGTSDSEYRARVVYALRELRGGQLDKVVLARELLLELPSPPSPQVVCALLRRKHPAAYVFAFPLPGGGHWIGASPELLVRVHEGRVALHPLAGTRLRSSDPEQDAQAAQDLLQSVKDQHEHRLMVASVVETLLPLCLELNVPAEPSLVGTPSLWHLGTRVSGTLRPGVSVMDVLTAVHPTPAVGGVPRRAALDLIRQLEGPRGLFGGAAGWCDAQGNGEWALGIRAAQLEGCHARLWAGAGIVADSDPAAECAETRAKLGVMLGALGLANLLTDLERDAAWLVR